MLKLTLHPHQKLWFFSDPHYSHLNLCKATTRWRRKTIIDGQTIEYIPDNVRNFESLSKMNDTIVNNINDVVGQDDILFCLGDWSFNGFDNIKIFRDRIVCKNLSLICGNHDEKIIANKDGIQSIFTNVYKDHYLELEVNDQLLVLSHFPICSWNEMAKGSIHLFGHVHLPGHQKLREGKAIDVGMDGNNFKPYSLQDILGIMKNQLVRSLSLPSDHHVEDFDRITK